MAYPQFYPIDCNVSIPVDVICKSPDLSNLYQSANYYDEILRMGINAKLIGCDRKTILFSNYCYHLSRNSNTTNRLRFNSIPSTFEAFKDTVLAYISQVSQEVIHFSTPRNRSSLCTIYKYLELIRSFEMTISLCDSLKGLNLFYLSKTVQPNDMVNVSHFGNWIFQCKSGEYISQSSIHDNKNDCADGDDEEGFTCYLNGRIRNVSLCDKLCFRPICRCSDIYYHKPQGGCSPYRRGYQIGDLNFKTSAMKYNLRKSQMNSIVFSDCIPEDILKKNARCQEPGQIHCTLGCAMCLSVHYLCVYELDFNNNLMHCPSGSHLKNCMDVECNNMFKCYKSYCVPYR